jgi:hypothetical protein
MIWYTEELKAKRQPEEATLTITGIYNPPESLESLGSGQSVIILRLDIETKPGETVITKILMEKNPSVLGYVEEPSPDDIQAKYYRQVLVARDKIMQTPFKDILNW